MTRGTRVHFVVDSINLIKNELLCILKRLSNNFGVRNIIQGSRICSFVAKCSLRFKKNKFSEHG